MKTRELLKISKNKMIGIVTGLFYNNENNAILTIKLFNQLISIHKSNASNIIKYIEFNNILYYVKNNYIINNLSIGLNNEFSIIDLELNTNEDKNILLNLIKDIQSKISNYSLNNPSDLEIVLYY